MILLIYEYLGGIGLLDIVLFILFMLIFFMNIFKLNKINLRVYITKLEKIILGLTFFMLVFIAYVTRNDFMSYIIAIFASLFFISGVVVKGIGADSFYFTVGRGLLVIPIKFSEVKDIYIKEKKDKEYLELRVKSSRGMSYERFKNEDREKIEKIIEKIKLLGN